MEELREQFEAVREGGEANMFDRFAVARVAMDMGLYELAAFAGDRRNDYLELLESR